MKTIPLDELLARTGHPFTATREDYGMVLIGDVAGTPVLEMRLHERDCAVNKLLHDNARLLAHAANVLPELVEALKDAREVLQTADRYFPKSIKNRDRFRLLNVMANSVSPALAKATIVQVP